jgi:hypothetical protein
VRTGWVSKRPVAWAFAAVAVAGLLALVGVHLYTPTSRVEVINNLGFTVEVSGCGDPTTIAPGGTSTVEAVSDVSADQCTVYRGDGPPPIGCLTVHPHAAAVYTRAVETCDG